MSYDVHVGCWHGNYTSNVAGMWEEAIGENLGDLIERLPDPVDLLPHLDRGVGAMLTDPEKYRAMEPDNGWGDYGGALGFLSDIATACREFIEEGPPRARVSR